MAVAATQSVPQTRAVPPIPAVEGPSAWIGVDMRKREAEWTYRLL